MMNQSLYYELHGSGSAVVFIHGFSLDRRMWQTQISTFARQHRVLCYDTRGFGRSPLPTIEYSPVEDLRGLLAELQIESATVVGLSRGGGIAINFALAHPELLHKLVLVDSVLDGHRWSDEQRALDQAVWERARVDGIEAGKAAWLAHPLFEPSFRQPAVRQAVVQMVADYSGWHFINPDPAKRSKPNAQERLAEIKCPTLVIVGEEDRDDFQQIGDRLAADIPNARKVVLRGTGHLPNMEAPELFNQLVLEFVEEE